MIIKNNNDLRLETRKSIYHEVKICTLCNRQYKRFIKEVLNVLIIKTFFLSGKNINITY